MVIVVVAVVSPSSKSFVSDGQEVSEAGQDCGSDIIVHACDPLSDTCSGHLVIRAQNDLIMGQIWLGWWPACIVCQMFPI